MKRRAEEITKDNSIEDYISNYEFVGSKDLTTNIKIFSELLGTTLIKNNIKTVDLTRTKKPISEWKLIALFKALKTNDSVLELDVSDAILGSQEERIEIISHLSEVLKINESLKSLLLSNTKSESEFTPVMTEILAEGIQGNRGLRKLSFQGTIESEANTPSMLKMMEAITMQGEITHLECDIGALISDDTFRLNSLVHLCSRDDIPILLSQGIFQEQFDRFKSFLQTRTNLKKIHMTDEGLDEIIEDMAENANLPFIEEQIITFYRELLTISTTLEEIDGYGGFEYEFTDSLEQRGKFISSRNQASNNKVAKLLANLDFGLSIPMDSDHFKALNGYHRMGDNLIKDKLLKEVDFSNKELVRKYAKAYGIEELENYKIKESTIEELVEWKEILRHKITVCGQQVYGQQEEDEVSALLNKIELYSNFHFFHFRGVSKDISSQAVMKLPDSAWARIASYLEPKDILAQVTLDKLVVTHLPSYEQEADMIIVGDILSNE